jgi:probable phosphoglycerate mutase
MSTLYLVRHGVTQANKENRFAGRTRERLHPEGIDQIRLVGTRLLDKDIAAIYCGPAQRTVESAAILGSMLKVRTTPLAELDEIYIPHWDGLTKDEIMSRYDDQYPLWLEAPQTFSLPGCETLQQVQDRATAAVEGLLADSRGRNLLLVSHLIVLRCLVLYCKGMPVSDFRSVKIDNGAIIRMAPDCSGRMAVSRL